MRFVSHPQEAYVVLCLGKDRLKAAARAVRAFSLQSTFPDVEKVCDVSCVHER